MKKELKSKRKSANYQKVITYGTYEGGCYGGSCYISDCRTSGC